MDPESEKQLAALIMEEAKRLRMRADREGVHAYLEKPTVRGRPNSQFLTATVRSVQQANRMAEINEMWRLREKELELEQRMHSHECSSEHHRSSKLESSRHTSEYGCNSKHIAYTSSKDVDGDRNEFSDSEKADSPKMSELSEKHPHYSAKRKKEQRDETDSLESGDSFHDNEISGSLGDEGLLDEEVDDFLRSRAKRGRGAVGSRMDETGPYLMSHEEKSSKVLSDMRLKEDWEQRIIGPSMPPFTKDYGCVAGLENLKREKSKDEDRRDRAEQNSKMHKDRDREIRITKSKKKHEKGNKSERKKGKKEKREERKKRRRDR